MKTIICNFSLFDMKQSIYIFDDETNTYTLVGKCDLNELGKSLTDACFANNIDRVHIYGHNVYVEDILHDIDLHSGCSAYSNGMIIVEVN